MEDKKFLNRLDQLIKEGHELVNECPSLERYKPLKLNLNLYTKCHSWTLSCLNLLRTQFGDEHYFFHNFLSACESEWSLQFSENVQQSIEYPREIIARAYAVLVYVKNEVELGFVADAKHLYEADLFSNLLEQAYELAEKDYLIGSAVYGRLIVENFINDLCRMKKVELDDKDRIPQKLTKLRKKGVFDLPLERIIQATYDIGTLAVHGKPDFKKYTKEQILDFLNNIRDQILSIK